MVGVFVGQIGEVDAYWNALHHLHVISGRVLRRKERKHRAGGAADLGYLAVVVLAGGVHCNLDRLPGGHVAQLRLLEVGRDPQIFQRNQREQVLPRGDVLVDLHALAGDDAGRPEPRFSYSSG